VSMTAAVIDGVRARFGTARFLGVTPAEKAVPSESPEAVDLLNAAVARETARRKAAEDALAEYKADHERRESDWREEIERLRLQIVRLASNERGHAAVCQRAQTRAARSRDRLRAIAALAERPID